MFEKIIYGITDNAYLRAILYLALWFVFLKLSVFVIEKVFLKLARKTKTDLDDLIVKKTNRPLTVMLFFIGIKISLSQLPLADVVQTNLHNLLNSIIGIVVIYIIYIIFDLSFSRVFKRIARRTKKKPHEALVQLTNGALKGVLIVLGLIYILAMWGVEIGPLLTGLGIGGLAVALALQPALSNIFSGISIILDKSINVGDLVNLGAGASGKIVKIGLRATKVQTYDNELIIVPNSKLASENIHNVAQPEPKTRVVVPFGVAYGADIDKVKKIILKEIAKINNICDSPEPSIKFVEMADSSLNFKVYFFVETFEVKLSALDEANTRIYNALNKTGIEIPFPQMDVHLKK